ncbi:RNA-binding S4 domain-containing protein [Alkaliphilus serpentinus]|uniref:RNA-binding S4 domain-containing protein n=1 Tax=Alkaliphilus serpentinus TaxID=1482731 RepID=A0A833HR00_9FIRM|nr:RNA-binding S4 domain-containing protein [Alkaliphilus serpentinus]
MELKEEYIKLDQLLKACDIVGSGGHAKIIILDGEVSVNGEVVIQRGKKIRSGDTVKVGDYEIIVE